MHDKSEDYNFYATIRSSEVTVQRVLCKLWLPRRMTDPIQMFFYPTQRQSIHLFDKDLQPFSMKGQIKAGGVTTICASEVWSEGMSLRTLDHARYETVFKGNPIDLQILDVYEPKRHPPALTKAYIYYFITPSSWLTPAMPMIPGFPKSEGKTKPCRQASVTIARGRQLVFDRKEHHERHDDEVVMFWELVGIEERMVLRREFRHIDERALNELDDFLAIVSFASRHHTICVGVDSTTEDRERFRYYRRNIKVPPRREESLDTEIIDLVDFDEFIPIAYQRFLATGPHEFVRHALNVVIPRKHDTVESSFTRLYAAVESLVLWYRWEHDLEFAISGDKWEELKGDLRNLLKDHRLLTGDTERKKRGEYIRANLSALQRVPFSIAFKHFCKNYGVETNDLWPMTYYGQGNVSLADIRNFIVHGRIISRTQVSALGIAGYHLRWTLERMLLAILGWDLQRSKIRPDSLGRYYDLIRDFSTAHDAMKTVPEPPTDINEQSM